jgi:hypothetical protein
MNESWSALATEESTPLTLDFIHFEVSHSYPQFWVTLEKTADG